MSEHTIRRAAVFNGKGGVTKTTTTGALGVGAALEHDVETVLVDLSGQNDLASQFGLPEDSDDGDDGASRHPIVDEIEQPVSAVVSDLWPKFRDSIGSREIVEQMTFDTDSGPDLIPSDPGLGTQTDWLSTVEPEDRYTFFEEFVSKELAPVYDLVLFDLPGGLENNLTLNGLYAAENVVAPVTPGKFEEDQFDALRAKLAQKRDAWTDQGGKQPSPHVEMVVPARVSRNSGLHREFEESVDERFGELATPVVRDSANVSNAQADGETLFTRSGLYDTGEEALEAYRVATEELLRRIDPQ